MIDTHINLTYRFLRRLLGQLGIALPFILIIGMGNGFDIEPSISDYYYTKMGTVFTGILIAFGLFLFSYRGHEIKPEKGEKISDNRITNAAGLFAIATALIPTQIAEEARYACGVVLCPDSSIWGAIHLTCAALFLFIMGITAMTKFCIGTQKPWMKTYFRISGAVVILSILFMAVYIFLFPEDRRPFNNGVFWGEFVALLAFGSAWLIKGRIEEIWIFKMFKTKN